MGGARRAAAQQQQQQPADTSIRTMLLQLAPLIILFVFTFLSAIPNVFGPTPTPDPSYAFSSTSRYSVGRSTHPLNVNYFVNPQEFSSHPISQELTDAQRTRGATARTGTLDRFERNVEQRWKEHMYVRCQRDEDNRQRRKEAKMGFFGVGADMDAIKAINAEKFESCEELKRLGVQIRY